MNAAVAVWGALTAPWWVFGALVVALWPRWREEWRARLLGAHSGIRHGATWIHASSVGEVRAAAGLIAHLEGPILLTVETDTGLGVARGMAAGAGGVTVAPAPWPHPWSVAPLWADAMPRRVVLIESATPWAIVAFSRLAGVPVVRVGARPPRLRLGRALLDWLVPVDLTLARGTEEAFVLGVPAGDDLKDVSPAGSVPWHWSRPFVAGLSTHEADECALLSLAAGVGLLLAPRVPARSGEIAARARASGRTALLRSAWTGGAIDVDVFVLDTLGELAGAVVGAQWALVGGGWSGGAHSPSDAVRARVPVCVGPDLGSNAGALRRARARVISTPAQLGVDSSSWDAPPAPSPPMRTLEALAGHLAVTSPELAPRPWAWPMVPLWSVGWIARNLTRRAFAKRSPVPFVAVTSQDARGPGKTSTARAVATHLASRGHRVGVLAHGAGRPDRRLGRDGESDPLTALGDEGALFEADGHLVASGGRRGEAFADLLRRGATAVVADDADRGCGVRPSVTVHVRHPATPLARGPQPAGERRVGLAPPQLVVEWDDGLEWPKPSNNATVRLTLGPWRLGNEPAPPPSEATPWVDVHSRPSASQVSGPVCRIAAHGPRVDLPDGVWATTQRGWIRLGAASRSRTAWRQSTGTLDVGACQALDELLGAARC